MDQPAARALLQHEGELRRLAHRHPALLEGVHGGDHDVGLLAVRLLPCRRADRHGLVGDALLLGVGFEVRAPGLERLRPAPEIRRHLVGDREVRARRMRRRRRGGVALVEAVDELLDRRRELGIRRRRAAGRAHHGQTQDGSEGLDFASSLLVALATLVVVDPVRGKPARSGRHSSPKRARERTWVEWRRERHPTSRVVEEATG